MRDLPVYPRMMSQAEQAKVLEACTLFHVDINIATTVASTSISMQGLTERVRKVSKATA